MSEHAGKVALITGITGQDGSYLTEFLLSKGYTVSRKIFRITHAVSFGSKQHTDEAESRGTHEVVGRGEEGIRHYTSDPHRKAKLIRLIQLRSQLVTEHSGSFADISKNLDNTCTYKQST